MKYTKLPSIVELSGVVDRPIQEKLPILPEDKADLTTSAFPHDDVCLEMDVNILFRIGVHRRA
jgi:hypothetical protein